MLKNGDHMKLRLKRIPMKPFVFLFTIINVVTGLLLGIFMTLTALVVPSEQNGGAGVWSILIFPLMNGIIGLASGAFLTGIYNFLAKHMDGIEMEFESLAE
jgi:hypothetical protein